MYVNFWSRLLLSCVQSIVEKVFCYVDEKTQTISLFNNSEKHVQILLKFSQQIVEGYKFILEKFC